MSYSAPFPGDAWTTAARLLATAAADPAQIVTHQFGLDEVADGFAVMRSSDDHRLKVMFKVQEG
jgi:L-iditol 2-dehydrogenase